MISNLTGRLQVRVYYEDTDLSGRVYHASYLRFFERGRTEWLRALGFQHSELAQSDGIAFAVTCLRVDYFAAALIDDYLDIITELEAHKGARLVFHQIIRRADVTLTKGLVEVVTLKGDRAVRPPRALLAALDRVTCR